MPIERNIVVAISQSVAFEPVILTSEQIYVVFPATTGKQPIAVVEFSD
jgi:hypothetical protein